MSCGIIFPLASIAAVRPVFMIVMAIFLMVIAWRLAKGTSGWTARLMLSGALLLGFGYGLLLPMYEAGAIEKLSSRGHYHGSEADAVAWHCVKLAVMNGGWLLFGLGLALHAKVFSPATPRRAQKPATAALSPHESVA